MAQKDDKHDLSSNIQQIILKEDLIYLGKEIVFIIVLVMSWLDWMNVDQITNNDFSNIIVFGLTTVIDAVVLAKQFKVKGRFATILLIYIIFAGLGLGFIILVITETLSISAKTVFICNLVGVFYCGGPLLEMASDIMSHLQNERVQEY